MAKFRDIVKKLTESINQLNELLKGLLSLAGLIAILVEFLT